MRLENLQEATHISRWVPSEYTKRWLDPNVDSELARTIEDHEETLDELFYTIKWELDHEIAESDPDFEFNPDLYEVARWSDAYKKLQDVIDADALAKIVDWMIEEIWSNVPEEFLD